MKINQVEKVGHGEGPFFFALLCFWHSLGPRMYEWLLFCFPWSLRSSSQHASEGNLFCLPRKKGNLLLCIQAEIKAICKRGLAARECETERFDEEAEGECVELN